MPGDRGKHLWQRGVASPEITPSPATRDKPVVDATNRPTALVPVTASRRRRRWPARLDVLQSATGLALGLFMWVHMLFVSSILLGKDAMWRQMDMPLAEALDYLRAQLAIELSTEDAIEGVKAFFEKRDPEWKGR